MSISIVNSTQMEIRRLAVAGSDIAIGDGRVKRLAPDIRKMGETVPIFARLADSIEPLVNPESGSTASKLLEAATLTNALLYTQGAVGIEGEMGTPGKLIFGLTVTDDDYEQISFARATLRYFLMGLTNTILSMGSIAILFTVKKQGLYDILAGTVVVKKL